MAKFRVEVTETVTCTRERYFEAESEAEARELAEAEDWREWSELTEEHRGDSAIEFIEEV